MSSTPSPTTAASAACSRRSTARRRRSRRRRTRSSRSATCRRWTSRGRSSRRCCRSRDPRPRTRMTRLTRPLPPRRARTARRRRRRRRRPRRRRPHRPRRRRPRRGPSRRVVATKRLGELLIEAKLAAGGRVARAAGAPAGDAGPPLTPALLEQALEAQKKEGGRIGEVLVKMRAVTEEDVLAALGRQLGIALLGELKSADVDVELASKVPIGFAKQHRMLALRREGDTVIVATSDPLDVGALDDLRAQLGAEVQPVLVPTQRILEVINDVYGRKHDKGGDLGEKGDEEDEGGSEELVDVLAIT